MRVHVYVYMYIYIYKFILPFVSMSLRMYAVAVFYDVSYMRSRSHGVGMLFYVWFMRILLRTA